MIADFEDGASIGDQIDVSEFSFSNFLDLTAHSHQRGDAGMLCRAAAPTRVQTAPRRHLL